MHLKIIMLNIYLWMWSLSKLNNINERHSFALHIHEQSQMKKHSTDVYIYIMNCSPKRFKKFAIFDYVSLSTWDTNQLA